LILVENTYLSSFTYNLLLAWISRDRQADRDVQRSSPSALIRYNLKKFFAEQLLLVKNCVVSRAIFLETLLFEQQAMADAFTKVSGSQPLLELVQPAVDTITQITRLHELTHHYLDVALHEWGLLAGRHEPIAKLVEASRNDVRDDEIIEMKCDVIAVLNDFQRCETKPQQEACLRAIVFGFATFAVMVSLQRSAQATIRTYYSAIETVDFQSLDPIGGLFDCSLEIDEAFVRRARKIQAVCEELAKSEGLVLYDDQHAFPLSPSLLDELLGYLGKMMESDDQNARNMSLMVATALHEHPRGIEFLKLHSKKFRSKTPLKQ
jgi:hypothetical protein